jgi:hypothetical protein
MKQLFAVISLLALAVPVNATPARFDVVNPEDPMVLVPGLAHVGWSRLVTVEHCAEIEHIRDWGNLTTDHDFERMERCLVEHT